VISQTGTYALRAALYLARHDAGAPMPAASIARELRIPSNYLAKILSRLSHDGVLTSTRGARGGYRLAEDPGALTVARVVEPFEDNRGTGICLLGNRPCDLAHPCAAHGRWSAWTDASLAPLRTTTVADLLDPSSETSDPSEHR
jgi:Rrf2 family protein